jgi:aminoglycoside phosphotransferase family enzyme/predicted kinase
MGIIERTTATPHPDLVRGLLDARAWPGATQVEHIETHISHVFLTGEYAYKIKKPLDLGFLDFSTLQKRQEFCEEELRINRRLAPELYLSVVPITGTPAAPRVEGSGTPIEYALKMRQFSQDGLLERVLERGELTAQLIDALAAEVAAFHDAIPRAVPQSGYGSADSIVAPAMQNFEQLAPLLDDSAVLDRLRAWTERENRRLSARFEERLRDGFVRECHGDLHLANIVLIDGRVRIFDALEFNPALRWIDVMNEIAFVVMDLAVRGQEALAARFLNAYLERTGDYEGVRVLRYYVVYRALVRAKVAAMRAEQGDPGDAERGALGEKVRRHLRLAQQIAAGARAVLVVHHGLSGSGKTTCSQRVLEAIGAVRIRSDVERKRLHGLSASVRTGAELGAGIYAAAASEATYARLATLAEAALDAGYPVLVDATFLERRQRDQFRTLAQRLHVPFRIAHFAASEPTLIDRIRRRTAHGADASEADLDVLRAQLRRLEPLAPDEQAVSIRFDTERASHAEVEALARQLVALDG